MWRAKVLLFNKVQFCGALVGEKMIMNVVNFLAPTVIDHNPEMLGDPQFFGHDFHGLIHHCQGFRRGFKKVPAGLFGDNQQMNGGLGSMVPDNDNFVGFVENPGGQFAGDNAVKN